MKRYATLVSLLLITSGCILAQNDEKYQHRKTTEENAEAVEFIYDYCYNPKTREITYADGVTQERTCSQYIVRYELKPYGGNVYIKIIAVNNHTNEETIVNTFTVPKKDVVLIDALNYFTLKWEKDGETFEIRTNWSYKNATEITYGTRKNRRYYIYGWDSNNQTLKQQCQNRERTDNYQDLKKLIKKCWGWKKHKYRY